MKYEVNILQANCFRCEFRLQKVYISRSTTVFPIVNSAKYKSMPLVLQNSCRTVALWFSILVLTIMVMVKD
jgi:hypothetical protein